MRNAQHGTALISRKYDFSKYALFRQGILQIKSFYSRVALVFLCFLLFSNVFANGILLFCLLHLFLCTLQQSVLPALCSLLVSGFLPCPALPTKLRRGHGFVFAAPVRCFDKILPIWLRLLALGSRMCYNSDVYSIVLECIKVRWNGHAALGGSAAQGSAGL